jgi:pimeloyl-ACP methyl ester carboxylesterase
MIGKIFPKISTRGFYDLKTGKTLKNISYEAYPKTSFEKISQKSEIVIMIHGLRNNKSGALAKYVIAEKRLKTLNYKYDVVGYSYDSNTAGVQYKSTALSALKVGVTIAKKNGKNLSKFIKDLKSKNPSIKIRLMGHSLGAQVILSTIELLAKNSENSGIIESVHLFGASIPANSLSPKIHGNKFQKIVNKKIINYYSPYDDVLKAAHDEKWVDSPIGYRGALGATCKKYHQKQVRPQNHRFASYAKTIKSFP